MFTVEFNAIPRNGMIELPEELSDINSELKVIVLTQQLRDKKHPQNNFKALSLNTKSIKFDRESVNERLSIF